MQATMPAAKDFLRRELIDFQFNTSFASEWWCKYVCTQQAII
jgi:hypothetical protein